MRYSSLFLGGAIALLGSFVATSSQAAVISAINDSVSKFSPNSDEAAIIASGAAAVTSGDTTIYIGTRQTTRINQDPIIASFTNGSRNWIKADYETTGTDARGIGLLWDGFSNLYAAFTTTGTQGTPDQDFRRFTQDGWLPTYGPGGGAKASVLLKLDPATGAGITGTGTFVRSQLSSGRTNTVTPTGLDLVDDQVVFSGESFFSPLRSDRSRMQPNSPDLQSPFDYRVVFNSDLTEAIGAEAIGWDGVTQFSPLTSAEIPETEAVPEPLTMLGTGAALGLGALMRRGRRQQIA
ncbi:MAG: PEP-CTERM sorting domain-containing protein [Leptolyngbyaceae cyanobacterium SM1_1_3]|nr:PEP-CTERM sorting domain-containing protein [Leptolyngbyaceae cyanobacterium SM1_1_3]NJN03072.1 PEP-CTERM sorting domain-containing protein [Leptolyngbyaceae cyanobacterium RM1_1_2]NJO08751.1 PEP-CTERM sorting domain-containing protein [Leptolyngbyaceae cyanobacterium SL_1_1]